MFLAAAAMLWGGWMLLPHHLGTYFQPNDFAEVHRHVHLWLWMYRVHIFGLVMTAMAMVTLTVLVEGSDAKVLVWPGALVAAAGFIVSALAGAFYYHFGVWGSIELAGKSPQQLQAFVESLRLDTEYVTCLVRFGRVFSGLGLLVAALGLAKSRILPRWDYIFAGVLGFAGMALTMTVPDRLPLYGSIFQLEVIWLAATGVVLLRAEGKSEPANPEPVRPLVRT
jgi:hypothetical protein